jgi:hypothetical protein
MKKTAFTIAEILLVMLILLTVTLATAKVLPEKARLKTIPEKHGTYACTRNGDQYYSIFIEDQKDANIPNLGSGNWKPIDKCGENLDMPNVDYIGVTLIGGGGAGGRGEVDTKTNNEINQSLSGSNITIDVEGTYEIYVASGAGTASSLESFRETGWTYDCSVGNARGGNGVSFTTRVNLKRGDKVKAQISSGGQALKPRFCAQFENYPKGWGLGQHGENITLTVTQGNTEKKITLLGGLAGSFTCNPNNSCGNRFSPIQGTAGSISGTQFGTVQSRGTSNANNASFSMRLISATNNNRTVNTPGCGGQGGKINTVAYPVKKGKNSEKNKAELPSMTIGLGGIYDSDNKDGGDTTFHSSVAEGGKANAACTIDDGAGLNNGTNGGDASAVRSINSSGGTGGSSSSLTGGNGTGYGAGGGGGAAISSSRIGDGGNGTNGLIIMTW